MTYDFFLNTFLITYFGVLLACFIVYKIKKHNKYKFIFIALLTLYILCVIKVVFLPLSVFDQDFINEYLKPEIDYVPYYQLVPLKSINMVLDSPLWYIQILGNILLLLPLSVFIGFMLGERGRILKICLIGMMTSVIIEAVQLIIDLLTNYPNKVMDIDDFILNSIGVIIGAICFNLLYQCSRLYKWVERVIVRIET